MRGDLQKTLREKLEETMIKKSMEQGILKGDLQISYISARWVQWLLRNVHHMYG